MAHKLASMREEDLEHVGLTDDSMGLSADSFYDEVESISNASDSQRGGNASTVALLEKETALVQRSKFVVYLALFLAAVAMGVSTYLVNKREEQSLYDEALDSFGEEVRSVADSNALATFGVMKSLATAISSYAIGTEMVWPNVTIPHFEARSEEALQLSGAELLSFLPIVREGDMGGWTAYANDNAVWLADGLRHQGLDGLNPGQIPQHIHSLFDDVSASGTQNDRILSPIWQTGPAPTNASIVMMDMFSLAWFKRLATDVIDNRNVRLSEAVDLDFLVQHSKRFSGGESPRSVLLQPVFDSLEDQDSVVGFVLAVIPWKAYFTDLLPPGTPRLTVEIMNTCGSEFHYDIVGQEAAFVGLDYIHDTSFDGSKHASEFAEFARYTRGDNNTVESQPCNYTLSVIPSNEFDNHYLTRKPLVSAIVVVLVFFFTTMVFVMYDWLVQDRQQKVLSTATRTSAIISSLFPKTVRQRMLEDSQHGFSKSTSNPKKVLSDFLDHTNESSSMSLSTHGGRDSALVNTGRPIADLFLETTVIFADIVGFTAWSSTREPTQVFQLLETIYSAFDIIAKRRRVFKVETVGDCYVAVAGLPEPRRDHAMAMARFARDCLVKMCELVNQLEVTLGPDTADLGMRFGLHSGPVTAGVLRGERARFQLFGDTVNTASRMESTGRRNMIHVSQETATRLAGFGKAHWLRPRAEKIVAKGKGELQTYFLDMGNESNSYSGNSDHAKDFQVPVAHVPNVEIGSQPKQISVRQARLVKWNTDVLAKLLKNILVRREAVGTKPDSPQKVRAAELAHVLQKETTSLLEEVPEIIRLPQYDPKAARKEKAAETVDLGQDVMGQLHQYIQTICIMYRDNPFHNFEHASHVSMSVTKLLSRIVAPDLGSEYDDASDKSLHDHTYGITSDPLIQFACVFSALIHDVDHPGIPNAQLVEEGASMASVYKNKSVAEQNSVDIAWELLMDDAFMDLREAIYTTADELKRFRQLVVSSVMATDIMDRDLQAARKARWNKAFSEESTPTTDDKDITNRKATIVIEHLIQASDVSHTMQHWHIYRKWNARLFEEQFIAFKSGRAKANPVHGWYEGEIAFFDHYLIPLAKKLKECGVFGVSSDEYLDYAVQNRQEWERRGRALIASMVEDMGKSQEHSSTHYISRSDSSGYDKGSR